MFDLFKMPQNTFFWSDIHACHEKDFILKPREFQNAQEAKETLISRWNEKVTNRDTGIILGDSVVGAGDKSLQEFESLLYRLNFSELFIMPGNHPAGFKSFYRKYSSFTNEYLCKTVDFGSKKIHLIPNYFEIAIAGQPIVLSHYPILSFNHKSKGGWHLFGHVHGNLSKSKWIADNYLTGRVLDLGVENCPYPVSFQELVVYMANRPDIDCDHH